MLKVNAGKPLKQTEMDDRAVGYFGTRPLWSNEGGYLAYILNTVVGLGHAHSGVMKVFSD